MKWALLLPINQEAIYEINNEIMNLFFFVVLIEKSLCSIIHPQFIVKDEDFNNLS
jgi:hypothetical protein